jgi:hypothetical protein
VEKPFSLNTLIEILAKSIKDANVSGMMESRKIGILE